MPLSALTIKNFRSVCGEWKLPLIKGKRPASLLLIGENGTGKSTVADALEFALQGPGRVVTWRNIYADQAEESWCKVDFLPPGQAVVRPNRSESRSSASTPPDPRFARSNFVIRRRELERFSSLPDKERSELLAGFLRFNETARIESDPERLNLVGQLVALKGRRDAALRRIALSEGLKEDEEPRTEKQFEKFVLIRRGGSPGMSRSERKALPALPSALNALVKQVRSLNAEIGATQRKFYGVNRGLRASHLAEELARVSDDVTNAFLALAPQGQGVRSVSFQVGGEASPAITIQAEFENGLKLSPFKVLSEAGLDLLALLTFTSLVKEASRHGQEKLLVLDDVFSSADASLRARFAEYLFREYADWQIVAIFHDRLWFEQFRRAALNADHPTLSLQFGPRRFALPPLVYEVPANSSVRLRNQLADPAVAPQDLASTAGYLLETVCEHLSLSLSIKVGRKLDDAYTIGDLWPGILSALEGTGAEASAKRVQAVVHLRNLVGAHFMKWAQGISFDECRDFAEAVLDFWDHTYCPKCDQFIRRKRGRCTCPCQELS
ncbi:hypothetical protein C1A38_22170 [Verrucosispora sp. ts21]|uniref:AAA family ATPase n=1 Tax=Verrucosispora sp. ts21 TaxID=2069341 RepID=UPI000C88EB81|nr:AAA family ATPase [Verrucosispora sp. ts21]PMR58871.1 hypothetical protein C1A38_22170 [Verrucosispora sp. ts21]